MQKATNTLGIKIWQSIAFKFVFDFALLDPDIATILQHLADVKHNIASYASSNHIVTISTSTP